jgi:N4-gp56 family major capsid protein
MSDTNISSSSPQAVIKFGGALFTRLARRNTFGGKLTGAPPKDAQAAAWLKGVPTNPGAPCVRITDLSQGPGDQINYDIVNYVMGKPTMGDRKIAGRMMNLSFATQKIRIDQYRGGIGSGGRMTRKRLSWNTERAAMANLYGWNSRLLDQLMFVHLAGDRGTDTSRDWVVPLASDPDFNDIVVNPIVPPSYNRRWVTGTAGGLGSITGLDNTDKLTLNELSKVSAAIFESDYPMQGVTIDQDVMSEDPIYRMFTSTRGFDQIRESVTNTTDWNTLVSNGIKVASQYKHPVFTNEPIFWRGLLIERSPRKITFASGTSVSEYNSAGALVQNNAPVAFDRSIIVGAQAVCEAWGADSESEMPVRWSQEKVDHGNSTEIVTSLIGGFRKLTFTLDGTTTDHGVWTVDHYNG